MVIYSNIRYFLHGLLLLFLLWLFPGVITHPGSSPFHIIKVKYINSLEKAISASFVPPVCAPGLAGACGAIGRHSLPGIDGLLGVLTAGRTETGE